MTKLHAHVFKGALLSVTLKKRRDGLAKTVTKSPKTKAADSAVKTETIPAPSRANRLIVRNLPFDITEQDLRAVFLPYGPIHSIHIPLKEPEPKEEGSSEQPKPRGKGYAFVWMLSKKEAEKALEGANGAKVHAGMADGLVKDKQKRKKLIREEAKIKQKEKERKAKRKAGDVKDEEDGEGEEEIIDSERIIAVDWALSKDKWEEAKAKLQDDAVAEGSEAGDEDSHIGVHDDSDDDSASDSDDDGEDEEMNIDEEDDKPAKPQLPPPETGTTLFVRNIPFEATEDELRTVYGFFNFNAFFSLAQF